MICHKHKCIYIHIPKTAGTSVDTFFTGKMQKHSCAKDYHDFLDTDIFNNYFKFTIVRNPWDLIVSLYGMTTRRKKMKHQITMRQYGDEIHTFEEFIHQRIFARTKAGTDGIPTRYSHSFSSMDQLNWIEDLDNKICMDYLIKFENLQQGFNVVCDKLNIPRQPLPHINKTKRKHYTEYYNDSTRDTIAKEFSRDIEYFGYKFGE